ncbi:MAG: SAM-dependent methyltransferase, partial [Pyrinomonadaceae bacterium]|nr:SAM-dependent methyltransferase [Pyrinomonadaceae bacterium]
MDEREAELREQIENLAKSHLESGDATGWFDELYKAADGDIDMIPWLDLEPNRFLVEWDNGKIGPGDGKRALVVGCGLGDEAE